MHSGYNQLKRIVGQGRRVFRWPTQASDTRAYAGVGGESSGARDEYDAHDWRPRLNKLAYITIVILLLVIFVTLGRLSVYTSEDKSINALKTTCQKLAGEVEAIRIRLAGYSSRASIEGAAYELGMFYPNDADSHVVQLVYWKPDQTDHTADNSQRD